MKYENYNVLSGERVKNGRDGNIRDNIGRRSVAEVKNSFEWLKMDRERTDRLRQDGKA